MQSVPLFINNEVFYRKSKFSFYSCNNCFICLFLKNQSCILQKINETHTHHYLTENLFINDRTIRGIEISEFSRDIYVRCTFS